MSHEHGGGPGGGGSKAGEGAPLALESTSVTSAIGLFIFGWIFLMFPPLRKQSFTELHAAQA